MDNVITQVQKDPSYDLDQDLIIDKKSTDTLNDEASESCWYTWSCCHHKAKERDETGQEMKILKDYNSKSPKNNSISSKILLPPIQENLKDRKCLVLDLDETLLHSSFKAIPNADFIVPVEIEHFVHQVYVLKRPHVDEFLRRCGKMFEVVIFTASLSKYADPVLDLLDTGGYVHHRLFRESCTLNQQGVYVKDLSKLGRPLNKCFIIDNSPFSYLFQPDHALPCTTWFEDKSDQELLEILLLLEEIYRSEDDIIITLKRVKNTKTKFVKN